MKTRQYRRKMQTAGSVSFMDRPVDNSFTYMGGNDKTPNLWGTSPQSLGISIPGNTLPNSMLIPNEYQKPIDEVQQANGPVYADLDDSKVKSNPYSISNVLSGNTPPSQQKPTQQRNGTWGDVMYGANVLGSWLGTNNANRQNRNYIQSNTANPLLNEAKNDGRSEGVQYGYNNFQNGGLKNNNIKMNKQQEAQILSAYLQQVPPQNRQAIMKQLGQLKQQSPQKYAQTIMQLAQQMQQGQGQQGDDQQQMQARYGAYMQKGGQQPQGGGGQDAQMQQVIQKVVQLLQSGQQPQQVVAMLVKMGIPHKQAIQLVQQVMQQLQQSQGQQGSQQQDPSQQAPQQAPQQGMQPQAMYGRRMQAGGYNPDVDTQQKGYFTQNYFPSFYKTATGWMQDGGQQQDPNAQQEGSPQDQQQDGQQGQQPQQGGGQDGQMQQIIQQIIQMLQSGQSPQQVVAALVKMGIPQQQAIQLVQQVMQQMQQQGGAQGGQQQQGGDSDEQQQPGMKMGGRYRKMGGRYC